MPATTRSAPLDPDDWALAVVAGIREEARLPFGVADACTDRAVDCLLLAAMTDDPAERHDLAHHAVLWAREGSDWAHRGTVLVAYAEGVVAQQAEMADGVVISLPVDAKEQK